MKKSASRGRPRKNEITKLKVMAWFAAVAQVSGKSAAELEREFADPKHIRRSKGKNKEIRPGLWDKYRRGEVEPSLRPTKGKSISVVQAVENKYPGTAKVLMLPLWKLMDFSQPMTMGELCTIQQGIPSKIQALLSEKSLLGTEPSYLDQMYDTKLQQSLSQLENAIHKWTMMAILVRKVMQAQRTFLIKLMSIRLDVAGASNRKRSILEIQESNPHRGGAPEENFKQAKLFL